MVSVRARRVGLEFEKKGFAIAIQRSKTPPILCVFRTRHFSNEVREVLHKQWRLPVEGT